ncbi:FecCD family ABC transporter permease [Corynebacterium callunae]|uniref:FecCD family ABC transporter permease n=1 Tax=Corynebacterium callunae TaxID=1721 RepID=UPI001FFF0BFD|nr:iron chelate uptake ABC transporter family permease subunit [Corynebacterium callunae]MCK2200938.1 iron chelate uptake ABC transporter family permease subunit [Corynebacterium callunae]
MNNKLSPSDPLKTTLVDAPSRSNQTSGTVAATSDLNRGYRALVLRNRYFSFDTPLRIITVSAILFVVAVGSATFAITLGDYPLTLSQVVPAIFGIGEKFPVLVVREWRLPVAIAAVVFGALLGIGGAIFQSLTRNPLGSPDVIGFDAGSYTAVVLVILVLGNNQYWTIAGAAIVGGLLTALAVYVLAWHKGVQGFRLIIVGIGVSAMLGSINAYLITRADVEDAMVVGFWSAGSINRVTWQSLIPSLIIAAIIFICTIALSRTLRFLEMGDDAAATLGFHLNSTRLALIVLGVATTALVTAAAGPISFIALVAPQLARRITHTPGVSLFSAAAMGAALLSIAHLTSLVIASFYRTIPVGLLTVCIGGCYMIWLIIRETRRHNFAGHTH